MFSNWASFILWGTKVTVVLVQLLLAYIYGRLWNLYEEGNWRCQLPSGQLVRVNFYVWVQHASAMITAALVWSLLAFAFAYDEDAFWEALTR